MSESNEFSYLADASKAETTPSSSTFPPLLPSVRFRFGKTFSQQDLQQEVSTDSSSARSMAPQRPLSLFYLSYRGCHHIAQHTREAMQGFDFRFSTISVLQLEYALTLAYYHQITVSSIFNGCQSSLNCQQLHQVAASIRLPTILACYIESFCLVKMSTFSTVNLQLCEMCSSSSMKTILLMDLQDILREANRPALEQAWFIDTTWIEEFNSTIENLSNIGISFRHVNNFDNCARSGTLVRLIHGYDLTCALPFSPRIDATADSIGAWFHINLYDTMSDWFPPITLGFDAFTRLPSPKSVGVSDICIIAFGGNFESYN